MDTQLLKLLVPIGSSEFSRLAGHILPDNRPRLEVCRKAASPTSKLSRQLVNRSINR